MIQNLHYQHTESQLHAAARKTLTFLVAQDYERQSEREQLANAILDALAVIEGEPDMAAAQGGRPPRL